MDLNLSTEQKEWQDKAKNLVTREILPRANEVDIKASYPWDIVEALAKEGLFGLMIPKQYGGLGQSYLTGAIVMEEIGKGCPGTGAVLLANWLGSEGIRRYGTEDQKTRYLPRMASGELQSSFAMSEYQAGSDAAAIETKAELKDGKYIINGSKRYAGNVEAAGFFVVPAKTSPEKRGRGITVFIMDKDNSGIKIARIHNKMGLRASVHGDLIIKNGIVPKENVLGEIDRGFGVMLGILDTSRIQSGAMAVGAAEAVYRLCLNHSKNRIQFERPLADNQIIQFTLADMSVEIQAARLLVHQAAIIMDEQQGDISKASATCKLYASEMVQRVTGSAMQIYAGFGYDLDSPVNRYYRDAKSFAMIEGTSEIQKIVISRRILAES